MKRSSIRFQRGSEEQNAKGSNTEGLGLGLFIARHIAEAHGGELSVACSDGRTSFTMVLPCAGS